jgi:Trk K+ transport system NAD-binding subunit
MPWRFATIDIRNPKAWNAVRNPADCLTASDMKSFIAILTAFQENRSSRANIRTLLRLLVVMASMIVTYSLLFHVLMEREGQQHSWLTGFYWTLTVMTTLGFGDITFQGDAGRAFSVFVLVTGVMFMLVILPFTFIQFFYAPWIEAQGRAKTPRELPAETRRHVILTQFDPICAALIPMLEKYGHHHVVLCPSSSEALELHEQGIRVAVGALDDPETYRRMRLERAAMLVTNLSETLNTNITFTAREYAPKVPIIASASTSAGRDMLELAGASLVMRLDETMAHALARRVIGNDGEAHIIGESHGLVIAEANAAGGPLVGKTVAESGIRQRSGLSVIGVWDHGRLATAEPDTMIGRQTVFVLAGTAGQIADYNTAFGRKAEKPAHVLIIGGGKVGRLTHNALTQAGLHPVIIEKVADRVAAYPDAIVGDATRIEVLKQAKAREASAIIVTSHDDDTNIALTIFLRRLRENLQIISRCSLERNVGTLHRAGADLVLSAASMGANIIFNELRETDTLLLAEGVCLFPSPVPDSMAGRALSDCAVRSETGCTIIAVEHQGGRVINPPTDTVLPDGGTLLLIGTLDAEDRFLRMFKPELASHELRRRWRKQDRLWG